MTSSPTSRSLKWLRLSASRPCSSKHSFDHRLPKTVLYGELSTGHRDKEAPRKRYKDTLKRSLATCNIGKQAIKRMNWLCQDVTCAKDSSYDYAHFPRARYQGVHVGAVHCTNQFNSDNKRHIETWWLKMRNEKVHTVDRCWGTVASITQAPWGGSTFQPPNSAWRYNGLPL